MLLASLILMDGGWEVYLPTSLAEAIDRSEWLD